MSAQFYHSLGRLARISVSQARLTSSPTLRGNSLLRQQQQQQIFLVQPSLNISTSKKNRETLAADVTPVVTKKAVVESAPKKKFWISQGYSHKSEDEDIQIRNLVMFMTVTVGMVLFSFIVMYSPDSRFKEWAIREGYIELARREALGLPLVDPDLIPLDRIVLPTEEELEDFEIIV